VTALAIVIASIVSVVLGLAISNARQMGKMSNHLNSLERRMEEMSERMDRLEEMVRNLMK